MTRKTVCIHDGTRMRSNPYPTSDLFWCPKCGGHDYKSVRVNGHRPAAPPAPYATGYTCPECGGPCEREKWRCSWLCPNCMIMFNDPDPVQQPADCTCIDLPDGRSRVCPTCRDRARAAAKGEGVPF
jgi:hypothetical protein